MTIREQNRRLPSDVRHKRQAERPVNIADEPSIQLTRDSTVDLLPRRPFEDRWKWEVASHFQAVVPANARSSTTDLNGSQAKRPGGRVYGASKRLQ